MMKELISLPNNLVMVSLVVVERELSEVILTILKPYHRIMICVNWTVMLALIGEV